MTFYFKIQILDVGSPDVWRQLHVPGNFSFHHFHHIIQASFGWTNSHLYEYSPEGIGSHPVITHPNFLPESEYRNSVLFKMDEYFSEKEDKIFYTYDFGDTWQHIITLEDIIDEPTKKAVCIDGAGACPPEDCGGPRGYKDFKIVINNPIHEEFASFKKWAGIGKGRTWDAFKFDKEITNRILEKM
jgi:Plasmid pRiA4b ORF-3-like protein